MNVVIHCFATWGLIYTSSLMKYKVKQNMNVINFFPVSIGANNCTRNKLTVKLIHWTSGFVLLIFTGSELQTLSKQCLCFVRPCFWPGPLQRTWEGGRKFSPGKSKNYAWHCTKQKAHGASLDQQLHSWSSFQLVWRHLLWTTIFSVLSLVHKNSLSLKPGTKRNGIGAWRVSSKSFKKKKERRKREIYFV